MAATPATRRLLVLDGVPGPWLPVGIEVLPQRGQGLAERIAAAFADAYRTRPLPMLLVGMDTPQLTAAAAHLLAPATDAVLGLAAQGNVHRGIDVGHPREVVHPQAGADPSRWFRGLPWAWTTRPRRPTPPGHAWRLAGWGAPDLLRSKATSSGNSVKCSTSSSSSG